MIASRTKWAGIAFAGGAALAVLSGCAQVPATYQPPAYFNSSAAAMRAYLEQQQRAENFFQPVPAPRPRRFAPANDGPVISQSPPVRSAPVPQAPADRDCPPGSWWDLCHFL
jgi:hypothetical protein